MNSECAASFAGGRDRAMPQARRLQVGQISTCYHEAGKGEPIVFIYGGNFGSADSASSAEAWDLNFVPLSQRYRVIAFDKLGQGYTENPARDEDYTMSAVVHHAAAFIRALNVPPVHLVGHSRGGFAATRLALEYQHLVRSLTIVNSGTLSSNVSTNELVLVRPPHPSFTRESARWVYEQYCFDPKSVTDDWIESAYAVLQQPKYRECVRKFVDDQLGARLFYPQLARLKRETLTWLSEGRLQRPTQIVWGYNDRTATVEGGHSLFNLIGAHERRTELHLINEAGHFPHREHPQRFNALLARFVSNASE